MRYGDSTPHPDDLFTRAEAAEYLGVGVRTLYRWASERVGPPYSKLGGRVRYRRSALDRWVAQCEVQPVRAA